MQRLHLLAAADHLISHALTEFEARELAAIHEPRIDAELVRQIDHYRAHRRMTEHDGRIDLVDIEDELLPDPEHIFNRLLFELARRHDSGVDEQVGRPMIAGGKILQEFEMVGRDIVNRAIDRVFRNAVAVEGLRAAIKEKGIAGGDKKR